MYSKVASEREKKADAARSSAVEAEEMRTMLAIPINRTMRRVEGVEGYTRRTRGEIRREVSGGVGGE